jgi:hypothetical protein
METISGYEPATLIDSPQFCHQCGVSRVSDIGEGSLLPPPSGNPNFLWEYLGNGWVVIVDINFDYEAHERGPETHCLSCAIKHDQQHDDRHHD